MILSSEYEVDLDFGMQVAPLFDLTGDGRPELRVRSKYTHFDGKVYDFTQVFQGSPTPGHPAGGEYLFTIITDPEEILFWSRLTGDVLGDHAVTERDLERVLLNFGQTGENLTPFDGDLNGDGVVDGIDADIVMANMGTSVLHVEWDAGGDPVPSDGVGTWPAIEYWDGQSQGLGMTPVGGCPYVGLCCSDCPGHPCSCGFSGSRIHRAVAALADDPIHFGGGGGGGSGGGSPCNPASGAAFDPCHASCSVGGCGSGNPCCDEDPTCACPFELQMVVFGGGHVVERDSGGTYGAYWNLGTADPEVVCAASADGGEGLEPNECCVEDPEDWSCACKTLAYTLGIVRNPIAYTRSEAVKVNHVMFRVRSGADFDAGSFTGTIAIEGTSPIGQFSYSSDPGEGKFLGGGAGGWWAGAENLISDAPLPPQIAYHDLLEINWTITVIPDAGPPITCSGKSENPLYVTLANPQTSPLYHTVLDIGCRNAAGMGAANTEGEIVEAIYNGFRTLNVKRAEDDVVLRYWNPHDSIDVTHTVGALLKKANGNGACTAWAHFFYAALRAQGIGNVTLVRIRPKWHVQDGHDNVALLVKNWRFCDQPGVPPGAVVCPEGGTAPPNCDPFTYMYDEPNEHYEAWPHLLEPGGQMMSAQGNPNPPTTQFRDHVIVRYQGGGPPWFDPSYGAPPAGTGPESSILAYEIIAFDGFGRRCNGEWTFKKNDPNEQETSISEWNP